MPRKYKEIEELYIYFPEEREKKMWADSTLLVYAFIKRAGRPYLRFSLKSISKRLNIDPRLIKKALITLQEFNYIKILDDNPRAMVIALNTNNKCKTFVKIKGEALNLVIKDKYPLSRVVIAELIKWLIKHKKKIRPVELDPSHNETDIVYAMNSFFKKYTAYSRITVWRALTDLEKAGVISFDTKTVVKYGRYRSARVILIYVDKINDYATLIKNMLAEKLRNKETNNTDESSTFETSFDNNADKAVNTSSNCEKCNKVDNTEKNKFLIDENCFNFIDNLDSQVDGAKHQQDIKAASTLFFNKNNFDNTRGKELDSKNFEKTGKITGEENYVNRLHCKIEQNEEFF